MPRQPEMKRWRPKESHDNGNSFGILLMIRASDVA
jgi:hypothetical protein